MRERKASIWWGPPRKFSREFEERKISWLELFYDLVYVIAISRATHHLAEHPDATGLIDYAYLFIMIYWGWVNGSLYHDIHGSPGIRTRIMTLWQMMAVAALVVCLNGSGEQMVRRSTTALMVLQAYITYLWWSVGIYDKEHRRLNRPYTICYLLSLLILAGTFYLDTAQLRPWYWLALVLNFLPPFLALGLFRRRNFTFMLSPSMVERLGLLTIILFGEAVLGMVNGTTTIPQLSLKVWFCFGLNLAIIFALWWVFFTLIADQKSRRGWIVATLIELGYIPTLASLGILATTFPMLYSGLDDPWGTVSVQGRVTYGISIAIFLSGTLLISFFLDYAQTLQKIKRTVQLILGAAALLIALISIALAEINLPVYLVIVFIILLSIMILMSVTWYRIQVKNDSLTQDN